MEQVVAKLLQEFEQGKISRRQLIQTLALTATAAVGASALPAPVDNRGGLKAVGVNHISYQVADYARTRDFYADLLGLKVSGDDGKQCRLSVGDTVLVPRTWPSKVARVDPRTWPSNVAKADPRTLKCTTPCVDHIAYTIEGWEENKKELIEKVKRRAPNPLPTPSGGLYIMDPDGFGVQLEGGGHKPGG